MKLVLTSEVSHKTNADYECLLVQWGASDSNFFIDKLNWMPTDDEVYALHMFMLRVSPSYKERLKP